MKQVIVFPRGQLDAKDKERMAKAGIVAVEADDPSKVVALLPSSPLLVADDLVMSLLKGLTTSSSYSRHEAVVTELYTRAKANELARSPTLPPDARRR